MHYTKSSHSSATVQLLIYRTMKSLTIWTGDCIGIQRNGPPRLRFPATTPRCGGVRQLIVQAKALAIAGLRSGWSRDQLE